MSFKNISAANIFMLDKTSFDLCNSVHGVHMQYMDECDFALCFFVLNLSCMMKNQMFNAFASQEFRFRVLQIEECMQMMIVWLPHNLQQQLNPAPVLVKQLAQTQTHKPKQNERK